MLAAGENEFVTGSYSSVDRVWLKGIDMGFVPPATRIFPSSKVVAV
jgi:hypothetical protein